MSLASWFVSQGRLRGGVISWNYIHKHHQHEALPLPPALLSGLQATAPLSILAPACVKQPGRPDPHLSRQSKSEIQPPTLSAGGTPSRNAIR
jgi:hypothetical protein